MDKTKAPVAHELYLLWLKESVPSFGFKAFPLKDVGSFCQEEMENKVAAVRTVAIEVMGVFYHQVGPRLLSIAISNDMKPQIKELLEAEFVKVGHDPTAAGKSLHASSSGSSSADAIPRQDLMSSLDKNIVSELNLIEGKTSWQNRKAAIEAIITACGRSGHYLESNKATVEVLKCLKVRVNDTQANLKPLAVMAIGHVLASFEPEAVCKSLKLVAAGIMSGTPTYCSSFLYLFVTN